MLFNRKLSEHMQREIPGRGSEEFVSKNLHIHRVGGRVFYICLQLADPAFPRVHFRNAFLTSGAAYLGRELQSRNLFQFEKLRKRGLNWRAGAKRGNRTEERDIALFLDRLLRTFNVIVPKTVQHSLRDIWLGQEKYFDDISTV